MLKKNSVVSILLFVLSLLLFVVQPLTTAYATTSDNGLITFSDMKTKAEGRTGWLAGRYFYVEIRGTVTNNTNKTISEDDLPTLSCTDNSSDCIVARLEEDELPPNETCKVSYRGDIYIDGTEIPELAFTGSSEYTGLHEAQEELAGKASEAEEGYKADDEAAAKKKADKEAKKAAEEKEKAAAKESIEACVGKTADEAFEVANSVGYDAKFKDSYGVNVTSDVKESTNGSGVHDAIVTEVETSEGWLFSGASATFKLDYTDPEAKKERDEAEAEEQAQKARVEELESCTGKAASEAKTLADEAGYTARFYDNYGVDVTSDVENAPKDSDISNALVTNVATESGWLFAGPSVTIALDYTDPEAELERQEEAEAKLREQNRSAIENRVGKSVGKSQILVDSSGYALKIYDSYGVNITKEVREAEKGSDIRRAKVTEVRIVERSNGKKPLVKITSDYVSPESRQKLNKEQGYPTEITFSNTAVVVEDVQPASDNPKYEITVTGNITNNGEWAVSTAYLPALGGINYDFWKCAEISLEGSASRLEAGESRNFELFFYTFEPDDTYVVKTENSDAILHGSDAISEEIGSKLAEAKRIHEANLEWAKEEEQRQYELQRQNQTCYITESGNCYHSRTGCPTLSRSNNIYETTVGWAESNGLTRCERCY